MLLDKYMDGYARAASPARAYGRRPLTLLDYCMEKRAAEAAAVVRFRYRTDPAFRAMIDAYLEKVAAERKSKLLHYLAAAATIAGATGAVAKSGDDPFGRAGAAIETIGTTGISTEETERERRRRRDAAKKRSTLPSPVSGDLP